MEIYLARVCVARAYYLTLVLLLTTSGLVVGLGSGGGRGWAYTTRQHQLTEAGKHITTVWMYVCMYGVTVCTIVVCVLCCNNCTDLIPSIFGEAQLLCFNIDVFFWFRY